MTNQSATRIINDLFDYRKMASMKNFEGLENAVSNHGSRKVTASTSSRLYGCFFNKITNNLFTVDEHCLVRTWDLAQGICIRSYPLEIANTSTDGDHNDNLVKFKTKGVIQTIKLSNDCKVFAVALQGGKVQINNAQSGAVLYNKAQEHQIDIENEVSTLRFFKKETNVWIAATAWSGEIAFVQRP